MAFVYSECSKCKREIWLLREHSELIPEDLQLCLPCLRPDLFRWTDGTDEHEPNMVVPMPDAPYKGTPGVPPPGGKRR